MAYSGGDDVQAVVADIGSYATKMGFAGEDYPRSYFRSNVAILREQPQQVDPKDNNNNSNSHNGTVPDSQSQSSSLASPPKSPQEDSRQPTFQRRRSIQDVKYDYFTRPLDPTTGTDGDWEVTNPVDSTTGLWYNHEVYSSSSSSSSSHNGNSHNNNNPTTEDTGSGSGADWYELLSTMIHHGYDSALGSQPQNHPLLMVERSYNPPPLRQQLVELLFEELDVPATFVARDATLACYATGRTTGTVVDMGHQGTVVTPVFDGYVEQKGIRRSPVGSRKMDERVLQTLDSLLSKPFKPLYEIRSQQSQPERRHRREVPFHQLARLDVARQCKEEGAGATVLLSNGGGGGGNGAGAGAGDDTFNAPHISYELPDGQKVDVPGVQRFAVANLVFGRDEESTKQRDDFFHQHQQQLMDKVTMTSQLLDDMEKDATTTNGNKDTTTTTTTTTTTKTTDLLNHTAQDKFSENAAVGLSTRRSKAAQQQHPKTSTSSSSSRAAALLFSNSHLQRACLPYLQNQVMDHLSSNAIPSLVCDAAFRCDRDQQAQLLGNVVVSGGGACLGPTDQAVPDVLREQVEAIIHTHTPGWRVKVLSPSIQERAICNWLGGSILGSLGTFHDMWITKAEYDEWGSAIVNRKCP